MYLLIYTYAAFVYLKKILVLELLTFFHLDQRFENLLNSTGSTCEPLKNQFTLHGLEPLSRIITSLGMLLVLCSRPENNCCHWWNRFKIRPRLRTGPCNA